MTQMNADFFRRVVLRGLRGLKRDLGFVSSKKMWGFGVKTAIWMLPERFGRGFVALLVGLFCARVLRGWRGIECGRSGMSGFGRLHTGARECDCAFVAFVANLDPSRGGRCGENEG